MKTVIAFLCCVIVATAEEIPLRNGKNLSGEIVGVVPASVKLKTESGNIIEIPVSHVSPAYVTNLPDAVSSPYKLIAELRRENDSLFDLEVSSRNLESSRAECEQAFKETAALLAQSEKKQPADPTVRNASAKVVNEPVEGFVEVSWKADVYNPSASPFKGYVTFIFMDGKGYSVDEAVSSSDMIFSPGSTPVSSIKMMKKSVWLQVKKFKAVVR